MYNTTYQYNTKIYIVTIWLSVNIICIYLLNMKTTLNIFCRLYLFEHMYLHMPPYNLFPFQSMLPSRTSSHEPFSINQYSFSVVPIKHHNLHAISAARSLYSDTLQHCFVFDHMHSFTYHKLEFS